MIGAYILVIARTGCIPPVMEKLSCMDRVSNVALVAGRYDIIVRVDAPDMASIAGITDAIHATGGIEKTVTHVISSEKKSWMMKTDWDNQSP